MSLSRRQRRIYTDTVSIYKPADLAVAADKSVSDVSYPSTPTQTSVSCHLDQQPIQGEPGLEGRSERDLIFTLDRFHFGTDVEIGDTYLLKLTTVGHPNNGKFWVVEGAGQFKTWRAGKQIVYAKQVLAPAGVS